MRATHLRSRRKTDDDLLVTLGKFAGLIGSMCVAVLGQAELVGEPWRHYVTVISIGSVAAWGYCLGPQHVETLTRHVKGWRK